MKAQPKASHYINGRYVEDEQGAVLPVIYPATGETIATLHSATPNVVALAVEAAREARPAWARLKPVERGRIFCNGRPIVFRGPSDAIRAGIGLLPEDRKAEGFVAGLTVALAERDKPGGTCLNYGCDNERAVNAGKARLLALGAGRSEDQFGVARHAHALL